MRLLARSLALLPWLGAAVTVTHARTAGAQDVYAAPTLDGDRAKAANEYVIKRMAAGFAGTVLVAHKGTIVLRGGYGLANHERGIPWSTTIVAPLGSVSKVFTAAAIVDLWDRRILTPTDKLGKFFPKYTVPSTAGITVHQLLTHTSGLDAFSGDDFEKVTLIDFLKRSVGKEPPAKPGSMRTSNVGFSLLAAIVEREGAMSMDSFLRRRLFNFAGITRTGYNLPSVPVDSLAVGYVNGERRGTLVDSIAPLKGDFWNLYGNGGMQGSAEDMYLWVKALKDGKVLTKAGRDALWAPQVRRPDGAEYGYGWSVRRDAKGQLEQVSNTGSDGVFLASLNYFPQEDLFVYVASNVGGRESMLSATISGVLRIMLGGEAPTP
jgi:CubicO group peptidase (beta-lactamase class C family)